MGSRASRRVAVRARVPWCPTSGQPVRSSETVTSDGRNEYVTCGGCGRELALTKDGRYPEHRMKARAA